MPIAAGRTACGLASLRFRRDNASSSGEAEICSPARRRMRKRQDIQYQTSLSTRVLVSRKPAIPKLACSNGQARPSPSPTPSIARRPPQIISRWNTTRGVRGHLCCAMTHATSADLSVSCLRANLESLETDVSMVSGLFPTSSIPSKR